VIRRAARHPARLVDDLRLAIDAINRAPDLQGAFDETCIGATRVTGSRAVALVLHRQQYRIAASAGSVGPGELETLRQSLAHGVAAPGGWTDALVLPLHGAETDGMLLARGARPESRPVLELFLEIAVALIDLHLLRNRAAAAAHRVHPADGLPAVLATVRPGDGVLAVAVHDLAHLRSGVSDEAGDAAAEAAGVHLLDATRPPGDVVVAIGDGRFMVVLRELKAPIDVVAERLLQGWEAHRPNAKLDLGAVLHVAGPPLATLQQAETLAVDAGRAGGGCVLVAAS
jgi:hypothetical protein